MDNEALFAAREGNLEKLKELLNQRINVDAQDDNGHTLLHHAVSKGQYTIVAYLLKNGADFFVTNDNGSTALHIAITKSIDVVVNAILANVARDRLRKLLDMKIKSNGNTALHIAAKNGCYENASILLHFGANFEIKNNTGEKPVDVANQENIRELFELIGASFVKAKNGHEPLISDLEKCNCADFTAVMNCRNNEGRTIMQVILINKHDKLSRDLVWLQKTSPIEKRDLKWTNYDRDRINKMEKLAERIEKYQDSQSKYSDALIMLAMHNRFQSLLPVDGYTFLTNIMSMSCQTLEKAHEVLLAYRKFEGEKSLTASTNMKTLEEMLEVLGVDPDQSCVIVWKESRYYKKLPNEWTENYKAFIHSVENIIKVSIDCFSRILNSIRLIHAINEDDVGNVQHLLDSIYTDLRDKRNKRVLCYAAEKGNEKIIRLLLKAGAKVVKEDIVSPVYLAANKGHAEVVKLLLENVDTKGMANFIDCQYEVDRTALHVTANKGYLNIVKILLRYGATYSVSDAEGCTPLDVSTNEEIGDFFKLIDKCFGDAKKADGELVYKLKDMQTNDFMAIANARNNEGLTLAAVADKADAKNIAAFVLKLIEER